jgi:hypothetical protein
MRDAQAPKILCQYKRQISYEAAELAECRKTKRKLVHGEKKCIALDIYEIANITRISMSKRQSGMIRQQTAPTN